MDQDGLGVPEAILFDLDGLLVDSEPVWFDVEYAAVERLGGQWSREHQATCVGGTIDKTCEYILALTGAPVTVADLQADLLAAMIERFLPGVPLHEGAMKLVAAVAAAGIPMGVVSSSYRVLVDAALSQFAPGTFAVTVSGDEVKQGKPNPDPFALACELLGVDPDLVVALEDSPMGVASAEAAGCRVIAVPDHAVIKPTPRRIVVPSLEAVDLALLRRLIAVR
jgi:HAD superfamily hydrolase (TIGR01509 family)